MVRDNLVFGIEKRMLGRIIDRASGIVERRGGWVCV